MNDINRLPDSGQTPLLPAAKGPLNGVIKKLFTVLLLAAGLAAQATPVFHGLTAANVAVTQNSTSTSSTNAVTLTNAYAIGDFRVGTNVTPGSIRGLYYVQIGASSVSNVQNGMLMTCVNQNGRNNNEGAGSAFPGTTYGSCAVAGSVGSKTAAPGATGIWSVPMFGNGEPTSATNNIAVTNNSVVTYSTNYTRTNTSYAYTSYNFNFAAAYFPYAKGFMGGWVVNTYNTNNAVTTNTADDTFVGNTNLTLGNNIIPWGNGAVTVDLRPFGLDSRSNAVMICAGGKYEENFASCRTNADGTWLVTCRDDQSGSSEDDPVAFVAIPLTNTMVVAGRFEASLNPATQVCPLGLHNAPFTATHIGTGTYHLTIPGVNPNNGVLIICNDEDGPNNPDNLVSYQTTNDGWIVQTRDTGSDQTPNLQDYSYGDTIIDFVFIPGPTPGITVTPTNGLATSQNGQTASFTVQLDALPAATVTLNLSLSDPTAGALSTSTLAFAPTNWSVPQTITVTGLVNSVTTPESYTVNFAPATSTDTNYGGFQAPSVSLLNIPAGTPGIFLVPATGLTTTGSGGAATFQAYLNAPPAADVTVGFSSSNPAQGVVAPASITFNSTNWNTAQTLTVTGLDDGVVDGNIGYQIVAAPAVSTDANYNGYNAGSVSVVNLENDIAGVSVSCGSTITVLEGYTTSFTVALTAPPVSNVTIRYASGDPTLGTVTSAPLTFTPANWNMPQTVLLTGVANPANQGSATFALTGNITTTNYGYSTLALGNIVVTTAKAIGLSAGATVYGLGMAPVGVDGQSIASSVVNFSGDTLTYTIVTNADATDVLGVRNDPTGVGIVVAGSSVTLGGATIASFAGGSGGTPLTLSLASGVTSANVTALIDAVTFASATTNQFGNRSVQISLNSGASIVSKSIRVGQLRVTQYQNGVDWGYGQYASQINDELVQTNGGIFPNGTYGADGLLVQVDANLANQHQVLLGFNDLIGTNAGQIPPGAIIVSADLSVNLVKAGQGWAFNRMLTGWDTNANWASFAPYYYGVYIDDPSNGPNAQIEYYSQMGNYVATTNANGQEVDSETSIAVGYVSVGVTPDLQAWASGATNYGWLLNAGVPWGVGDLTTGTAFTSGQDANPAIHPNLRVYWLPPGVATGVSFQGGVNGYTNAVDTGIIQSTSNSNNVAGINLWCDGADLGQSDQRQVLLRFDGIFGGVTNQIPPGAHIEVAMLNLASLNSADSVGNGGKILALLRPWDTNTLWGNWDPSGNGIVNDGIQAAIVPTATAGVFTATATGKVPGGYHSFEVTPDVQNWANYALPNYGWGIVPYVNGADGWGINTSKDPNTNSHPQLVVYYTLPAGTELAPTGLSITSTNGQYQLNFAGSANGTYTVWRASVLTGPWTSLGTVTANAGGLGTYLDAAPLSAAGFYRVSTTVQ